MTSLQWEFTAFALRLGAGLCAIAAIAGGAMVFGFHGLGWTVVAVLAVGTILGAVLIVLEDRALWRARAELRRETEALR